MNSRRAFGNEPDVMDLVEGQMSAMNATIEDLEDSLVLLKTAIKDSNGISSQVEQPVASTLRPQIIVNDASTSKNGKRGKKAKAKSMVDMPGVAMRRRHASSPDLFRATGADPVNENVSGAEKHKKGRSSSKHSRSHKRDMTASEEDPLRPSDGEPDRLTAEKHRLPRTHSHSGAKAMLTSIFHRRPSHSRHRSNTVTAASINNDSPQPSVPPPLPAPPRGSTSTIRPTVEPPILSVENIIADLTKSLENIRHQHSSLLTLLPLSHFSQPSSSTEDESTLPDHFSTADTSISPMGTPLRDHESGPLSNLTATPSGSAFVTARTNQTGHRSRGSLSSLYAEVASIYYDAEIEPWAIGEDESPSGSGSTFSAGSRGSLSFEEADKHVEAAMKEYEDRQDNKGHEEDRANRYSVDTVMPPKTSSVTDGGLPKEVLKPKHTGPIVRRTSLPCSSPASEPSLIGMLRKNVGKDLSTISFDVTFNEPLSLLQKLAEEVEYTTLLALASQAHDSIERLAHIAAFAVSQYANSKHRTSRKPFNPLQGETYELIREDLGLKFVSEKVTHHPPRMACHAEGQGWVYWCTSAAKNKLSGMSLEIQPVGKQYIVLNGKEKYSWTKPKSYMRNLVAGTKYLETTGDLIVHNESTSEKAIITFEAAGWSGKRNLVTGVCYNAGGTKVAWIDGVWDSKLNVRYGSSHDPSHPLWIVNPWPSNMDKNYGFTSWAIGLNEITPDVVDLMAPSDSRYRPDQRAYEEGRIDDADNLKTALEEAQRRRRQELGGDIKPRWFRAVKGEDEWVYGGGYFESREQGKLQHEGLSGLFEL